MSQRHLGFSTGLQRSPERPCQSESQPPSLMVRGVGADWTCGAADEFLHDSRRSRGCLDVRRGPDSVWLRSCAVDIRLPRGATTHDRFAVRCPDGRIETGRRIHAVRSGLVGHRPRGWRLYFDAVAVPVAAAREDHRSRRQSGAQRSDPIPTRRRTVTFIHTARGLLQGQARDVLAFLVQVQNQNRYQNR